MLAEEAVIEGRSLSILTLYDLAEKKTDVDLVFKILRYLNYIFIDVNLEPPELLVLKV